MFSAGLCAFAQDEQTTVFDTAALPKTAATAEKFVPAGWQIEETVTGDLNNDGLLDVVINCNDGPALVLMNRGGNGNHWLIVNTVGTRSNRDGIGARIRVVSESGVEQHGFVSTAGSYASASDKRVHFGLGSDATARRIEIVWPSGTVQVFENIRGDRVFTAKEPA